jgi:hypothetical protein
MVSEHHFFQVVDFGVMVDSRVEVKQHREVNLLLRIE